MLEDRNDRGVALENIGASFGGIRSSVSTVNIWFREKFRERRAREETGRRTGLLVSSSSRSPYSLPASVAIGSTPLV